MAIQTKLDKSKSYGRVVSTAGAGYTQNGLMFDGTGQRSSEITKEEALAEIANEAAEKARAEAMKAGDEAAAAVLASDENAAAVKAAAAPVKDKEMPDFKGFTKKAMIEYAAEHFKVKVDPKLNHAPMVLLMKGLF
jgi:hypothetical protein